MPVEFTRTEFLQIITVFLVVIFALYFDHSDDDTDVRPATDKKIDYGGRNTTNYDLANSSIEKDYGTNSTPHKYTIREDILWTVMKMQARLLLKIYRDVFLPNEIREPAEKLHPFDRIKFDLGKFNTGIVALGVRNFMMAATQFCKEEAAAGDIPIVSIGSGDGMVEKEIIAQYRERFGKEIRIQLIDPDPKFDEIVDFKTVDHLIAKNPRIVGNCVTLIIWPNPVSNSLQEDVEDNFDLEAVQKLQPKAALTVYEITGMSGSRDFRAFLREDSEDDIPAEDIGTYNWFDRLLFLKKESYGLDNYAVLEMARQKIIRSWSGTTTIFRMVKIVRTN